MTAPFRPALDGLVPYEPGRPVEIVQRELGLDGPDRQAGLQRGPVGPGAGRASRRSSSAARAGNRYPDGGCWALRSALAERHGLAFEQVVVGNGADGVLNYLALAMLEPGDEVAFCWPSFPVYPINAAKMGAVAVRAPLERLELRPRRARRRRVSERTKLVYVTNPNNPTGGMVTRAALERFLDGLPEHVLPVLDEAYFEYVDDPEYPDGASEQLARGRRCVVLRTFSKIYGLAGFRVGYGLCPPDVAAACLKVKNAFDVTQSALDAALASLGAGDEVARRRDETRAGRERLAAGLRERGFAPLDGRRQLPLRRRRRRRGVRRAPRAAGRDRAAARAVRRSGLGAHQRGLSGGADAPLRGHRRGLSTRQNRRRGSRVVREGWDAARSLRGIAAALVVTAVALGAGTDVRIHRLHVPPPPTGEDERHARTAGARQAKSDRPRGTARHLSAGRAAAAGARRRLALGAARRAHVHDRQRHERRCHGHAERLCDRRRPAGGRRRAHAALPRREPPGGTDQHNLSLRDSHGTFLCGTRNLVAGEVADVHRHEPAAGDYELYCTIHVAVGMKTAFTVN